MAETKHLADVSKIIPAVECLIVKDGKVLLIKRSESAKRFPGYWIGPGGHVDENEDVLSAAIREVWEETGVKIDDSKITLKAVVIGNHTDRQEVFLIFYFLIHLNHDQELKNSSEGDSAWFPVEEVKKMEKIFPPFKHYLSHALDENSGILYTNTKLENLEVIEELSRRTDKDK